ncbi:hypothetical protein GLOIN_2v1783265 [Rhizophagus irregularis DAOM 181602=DAOM 197198]|uniref:Uncharacterized protein n=1 Tax=Rhizophagus irregularis (strain DAOM 181602 / DAOM 197198 / MUCL 43194) TaxID=747089 RepID=A0A2H5SFT8_RHIID|nr:hypothetical protein GLOIN_2v1783265 [Rhizophagus irregularis DAOM 181602=DAOM 197198]POG64100.1 hypothetical protein GLOIN_2v1783265 [Rhizophagus irregularis DAOM 181602=DAOM 197198]|eukprot:XP_025170966.1 hypothetical protein GLOIN_2v1783265 [Rhizophagus irregularis DAOM 181602=DAOM 197198]
MEEAGWISIKGCFVTMFCNILVGKFSEAPYLLSRVKEDFIDQILIIAVPDLPTVAVVRVCQSLVACKDKKNGESITLE